jgi:hypothetical protein
MFRIVPMAVIPPASMPVACHNCSEHQLAIKVLAQAAYRSESLIANCGGDGRIDRFASYCQISNAALGHFHLLDFLL